MEHALPREMMPLWRRIGLLIPPRFRKEPRDAGKRPDLGIAQVEVTTRCNHRCTMCPGTFYRGTLRKDLDFPVFERLSGFLPRVSLVYLQGWGEPLLHPRLFDMVALAREKGCRTGFTTNGSLLDENTVREAVRLQVKYITVSLAGADAATHNRIRRGSDFHQLLADVARLVEVKKEAGREDPQIHLSYMLSRESVTALPRMVSLARELGVDRLVAPNLDCPITPEDEKDRVFDWGEPDPAHRAAIEEAQALARTLKLELSVHPLQLTDDVLVCELNPLTQFFVNVDGEVSPCVYTSIVGRKEYDRYFRGEPVPTQALTFGSLQEQDMEDIWQGEEYRRFRRFFVNRLQNHHEIVRELSVRSFPDLNEFSSRFDRTLAENPFPPVCRQCYKAYGA